MRIQYVLGILVVTWFSIVSCAGTAGTEFHGSHSQGFYKYGVVLPDTPGIVDTIYTTVQIETRSADTVFVHTDILHTLLGVQNKLIQIWGVTPVLLFSDSLQAESRWDVAEELGSSSTVNYTCLHTDSTIVIGESEHKGLTFIERKEWLDVGGGWKVTHYAFDNDYKLIYWTQFISSDGTFHEEHHPIQLVLIGFHEQSDIPPRKVKEWDDRNTDTGKALLRQFEEYFIDGEQIYSFPPTNSSHNPRIKE